MYGKIEAMISYISRDSSAVSTSAHTEKTDIEEEIEKSIKDYVISDGNTEIENKVDETDHPSPHTPSLQIEDLLEDHNPSITTAEPPPEPETIQNDNISASEETNPNKNETEVDKTSVMEKEVSEDKEPSEKSIQLSIHSKSTKSLASTTSRNSSPEPNNQFGEIKAPERDVRTALAECIVPSRHEDWEVIVNRLQETERLAKDEGARAPAASWRAATRSVAAHVRSLRSRVARAACSALGSLFEHRGRALDPELEEASSALLERCADVNRFLRADAISALCRVACGGGCARAGVALARRGATHRAGPVRAAAAQALTRLIRHHGAERVLDLSSEPRTFILRAAGELLADASPEARLHAKHLCLVLSEDQRFRQMLKDAMPLTRYRAIEKYVDKLRCR